MMRPFPSRESLNNQRNNMEWIRQRKICRKIFANAAIYPRWTKIFRVTTRKRKSRNIPAKMVIIAGLKSGDDNQGHLRRRNADAEIKKAKMVFSPKIKPPLIVR